MSGLIVGLVLRTPISEEFNTEAKFIATVYADHAWEDGTHAHPAVDTVAHIVGLHPRTVQRYLRLLEVMGMLIPSGKGPRGTNQYKFPLDSAEDGSVRLNIVGGGTLPPRQPARGDTESGDTESGDTMVSPKQTTHQNLVGVVNAAAIFKNYESEFGALTPMIADAINDDIDTYSAEWVYEAMQIAVRANKRSWNYVNGILKRCKAKNVRPSLNRLENQNGNNGSSNSKSAKSSRTKNADSPAYTDADRAAAERVKQRSQSAVPAV